MSLIQLLQVSMLVSLLYFSDYKTHPPPKFGRKMGVRLIVQIYLTWLAGVGRAAVEQGFFIFFLFSSSKTQVCLMVQCVLQLKKKYSISLYYLLIDFLFLFYWSFSPVNGKEYMKIIVDIVDLLHLLFQYPSYSIQTCSKLRFPLLFSGLIPLLN